MKSTLSAAVACASLALVGTAFAGPGHKSIKASEADLKAMVATVLSTK